MRRARGEKGGNDPEIDSFEDSLQKFEEQCFGKEGGPRGFDFRARALLVAGRDWDYVLAYRVETEVERAACMIGCGGGRREEKKVFLELKLCEERGQEPPRFPRSSLFPLPPLLSSFPLLSRASELPLIFFPYKKVKNCLLFALLSRFPCSRSEEQEVRFRRLGPPSPLIACASLS